MGHVSISEKERQTANPILQAQRAEWRGDIKASHRVWKAHLVGTVESEGEDTVTSSPQHHTEWGMGRVQAHIRLESSQGAWTCR